MLLTLQQGVAMREWLVWSKLRLLLLIQTCVFSSSAAHAEPPSIFDDAFAPVAPMPKAQPATTRSASSTRRPMPTKAALDVVRPLLEEVYARELADTSTEGRLRLASKLEVVAKETREAPVEKFALLDRAHSLAASSGDANLTIRLANTVADEYEVDATALSVKFLTQRIADKTAPPGEVQNLIGIALAVADVAAGKGNTSDCEALLKIAERGTVRIADAAVVTQLQARESQIRERLAQLAKVVAARHALEQNPDDARSAALLGSHLCFVQNDWSSGLPLLAKCNDVSLRALAGQELAGPKGPSLQASLADGWWRYADHVDPATKPRVMEHAAQWYARAEPYLSGFQQDVARSRMREVDVPVRLPPPVDATVANRIVFVCDATGTMLGLKFKILQAQLTRAVGNLSPSQSFNIIFFQGGDSDAEWRRPLSTKLEPATDANKEKCRVFLSTSNVTGKGTNPLPALRLAIQQKPEVIYFLTDGEFNNVVGYEQVIAEIRRLNVGKRIRFNTIAFMSDDAKGEAALRTMAVENNGTFKKVSDRDLE